MTMIGPCCNTGESTTDKQTVKSIKLNNDKGLLRCLSIPFLSKIIPWWGVAPNLSKIQVPTDMPWPKTWKELQIIHGYTTLPRQVFTSNGRGVWAIIQADFSKSRLDIKQDIHRSIWESENNNQEICALSSILETNVSRISLWAGLLQVRNGMNCRCN